MGVRERVLSMWRALIYGPPVAVPPVIGIAVGGQRAPLYEPGQAPVVPVRRQTRDADTLNRGSSGMMTVVAPPDWESEWRTFNLDRQTLDKLPPQKLVQALADLSPEISAGTWLFLRLCNPGWEIKVYPVGGGNQTNQEELPAGRAVIDKVIARLDGTYGSIDVVIGRLFMAAYLRGAFFVEAIFDAAGREMIDLAVPDPATARYRRTNDPQRGQIWQLGQVHDGNFAPLDQYTTIRYLPIDPFPDSPYGRPLVAPALFVALFTLGLLHDLRRVVSQQGYPRYDLVVQMEKVINAMPMDVRNDPTKFRDWVTKLVGEVGTTYAALEPDDAFIHTDEVEVNRPTGTVDAQSLVAGDGLIAALASMAARALKIMPMLMGITDSTSEANANRQWEVQAASIKSVQHLCERLLQHVFGLALQAAGVQGEVQVRFAELRAAEELRDAQTQAARITNAWRAYLAGWISQAQAADMAVGQEPDQEGPRLDPDTKLAGTTGDETGAGAVDGDEPVPTSAAGQAEEDGRHRPAAGTRAPFVPDATGFVPPAPVAVVEPSDLERAAAEWDHREPDHAGLLDAEPTS